MVQKNRLRRFVSGNVQDFIENGVIYYPKIVIVIPRKKWGRKNREKRNGKKKGLGEKSFFNASESEPSEREARETCERTRKKSVTGHKVSAPALGGALRDKMSRILICEPSLNHTQIMKISQNSIETSVFRFEKLYFTHCGIIIK